MVSVANRPQIWSEGQTRGYPDSGEASFYDRHAWCLNPLLTLEDQLTRVGEELDHARSLAPGWQRDECVINVYLLVCGIGCTVDDYLGRRAWDMSLIAEHFPRLRFAVAILRRLLSLSHELSKWISDRSEEHTSELQSQSNLVCRLLLEKKKKQGDESTLDSMSEKV